MDSTMDVFILLKLDLVPLPADGPMDSAEFVTRDGAIEQFEWKLAKSNKRGRGLSLSWIAEGDR